MKIIIIIFLFVVPMDLDVKMKVMSLAALFLIVSFLSEIHPFQLIVLFSQEYMIFSAVPQNN
jgi:hypothetical protein